MHRRCIIDGIIDTSSISHRSLSVGLLFDLSNRGAEGKKKLSRVRSERCTCDRYPSSLPVAREALQTRQQIKRAQASEHPCSDMRPSAVHVRIPRVSFRTWMFLDSSGGRGGLPDAPGGYRNRGGLHIPRRGLTGRGVGISRAGGISLTCPSCSCGGWSGAGI